MTVKDLKNELNKYPDNFNIVWEGDYECAGLNDFNNKELKIRTVAYRLTHGQFARGKSVNQIRKYFTMEYKVTGSPDWDDIERKFGYDIEKTVIIPPTFN